MTTVALALTTAAAVVLYAGDAQARTVTLDEVLEEVPERHETQEITEMQIRQSQARRRQALAALLPQLSASANVTRVSGEEVDTAVGVVRRRYDWGASATASMTLFDGPAYFDYWQADALIDMTEYSAQWQRHLLELDAEVAFYTLASAQREVEIAAAAIEWRQDYLDQAEALVDAGLAVAVDVSRARTQVLEAGQRLLEAEAVVGDAADSLAMLMGMEPNGELRADFDPEAVELDVPEMRQDVTEERADFAMARAGIEASELGRRGIWWSLAPTVGLSFNNSWGRPSAFDPDIYNWSLVLSANWVLYDGGARYARADAAQADVREQELVLERDLREADAEMARSLRDWQTAAAAIELAEEQVDVAQQTFDQIMAQFEAGLVTSIEVSDASQQLLNAELGLNQVRLEARLAEASYRYLQMQPD